MKKLSDLNYYELLEVDFDASPFEIYHAYKEIYQLYREDSLATYSFFSPEERKDILSTLEEAYFTLIDENKRSRYDLSLIERGVLEEGMQYQRGRNKVSFISNYKYAGSNLVLRIRERLKPIVSSNPVIQEILSHEILSGTDLKKIRDELGVSLEEISEMVKVRVMYLSAIEEDQPERTPSRLFLRSFLRAYAQCIGLDADIVANRYLKGIQG
jgi:DnaJ-class molecular chaperone